MKNVYILLFGILLCFNVQAQTLNGITPNVSFVGQTNLSTTITASNLFQVILSPQGNIYDINLRQGANVIPIYDYNTNPWNPNVNVIDADNVTAIFSIPGSAVLGLYDLELTTTDPFAPGTNLQQYNVVSAFTITNVPSYLSGVCYFDANSNGTFDLGEAPLPNVRLNLSPESSYSFSDNLGEFQFGAYLGSHVLSYSPLTISNLTLTSAPSYSFTNTGNQSGFDFGFRSPFPDYSASITYSSGFARCNTLVSTTIHFSNTSNVVSQGKVYFVHSPNAIYSSSVPAYSSLSGDTIFWDFTTLQPLETRSIVVVFMMPGAGNTVYHSAGINVNDGSGVLQFSDTISSNTGVRCAYDPNDKAAFPEGENDIMHYTLNYNPLEYLIRFQNTGNDTAFTVYIRDTIDVALDLNTMEVLAASHNLQTEVDSNRAVVFMFANILLADSVVDEPNSHGFVRYRISPLAGIPDPIVVENTAYIYFDSNPPVITNTAWNTLVQMIPVGLFEPIEVAQDIFFYPNPMDERGYLSFVNPKSDKMILEIYDIKGMRVIFKETSGSMVEINRDGLSSGLYIFKLSNSVNGKTQGGKISIR